MCSNIFCQDSHSRLALPNDEVDLCAAQRCFEFPRKEPLRTNFAEWLIKPLVANDREGHRGAFHAEDSERPRHHVRLPHGQTGRSCADLHVGTATSRHGRMVSGD